jgi:hypothetical protein
MICLFGNENRTNESSKSSTLCHYPDRSRDHPRINDHLDIESVIAKTMRKIHPGSYQNADILFKPSIWKPLY